MKWLYEEIKQNQGVETARSLINQILQQNKGNITKAAKILSCSRKTIRRARDWPLKDYSRKPLTPSKNKTSYDLENLILSERKNTKYWRVRLEKHIKLKFGIPFSSSTIWKILKRNNVKKHKYSRKHWDSRPLYDYEKIKPFEYLQVDTKHIDDFGALWELCFRLRKYNLPLYQWSIIDAKSKFKFIAYSHSLKPDYWLMFILLVTTFIRGLGIDYQINFQADNWPADFCWGSKKKEEKWNDVLWLLNTSFYSIPAWKKYLQWIVERSHRTDDEELYRPYLWRVEDINQFLFYASRYINCYNTLRPSFGIWMNWFSPIEKLKKCHILCPSKFSLFPIFILEDLEKIGGTYLRDHYLDLLL